MPTILLLGAQSDIAAAIARKFAAEGYAIQLAARQPELLHPLQSDLQIRHSVRCSVHAFDAQLYSTHDNFFSSLPETPDITICVFGYLGDQQKAETDWEACQRILDVNYTGAVSILNRVASVYDGLGRGMIIGISSVAGERGRQSNYFYGSAKAGFTVYLSGLRNRLFPRGVHVMTVKPGFVYTRMTDGMPLPALLTATPKLVADRIYTAVRNKKNTLYVKGIWYWIMLVIRTIPEPVFKKLKL
jgi:short-subunit dehydrogenase